MSRFFARSIRITGPMLAAVTSGRTFRAWTATGSRELPVSARATRWRRSLPVERHAGHLADDPRLAVDEPQLRVARDPVEAPLERRRPWREAPRRGRVTTSFTFVPGFAERARPTAGSM